MREFSKIINENENKLSKSENWKEISSPNTNWKDDPIFSTYHPCSTKQKGVIGEKYVESFFQSVGFTVEKPTDVGHDRIVGGIKTEIKFSLAKTSKGAVIHDEFMINHVSICKDWERLVFCGINPKNSENRVRMYFMEKKDFEKHMKKGSDVFKPQQAGKSGNNDDYICSNFSKFVNLPFVKEITRW